VGRVGIKENSGAERPDDRRHPAVVIPVVVAHDDQVDRLDSPLAKQPEDSVRRPGIH